MIYKIKVSEHTEVAIQKRLFQIGYKWRVNGQSLHNDFGDWIFVKPETKELSMSFAYFHDKEIKEATLTEIVLIS